MIKIFLKNEERRDVPPGPVLVYDLGIEVVESLVVWVMELFETYRLEIPPFLVRADTHVSRTVEVGDIVSRLSLEAGNDLVGARLLDGQPDRLLVDIVEGVEEREICIDYMTHDVHEHRLVGGARIHLDYRDAAAIADGQVGVDGVRYQSVRLVDDARDVELLELLEELAALMLCERLKRKEACDEHESGLRPLPQ